ncbi:MAG: hypothetical protein ACJ79S_22050 [Gemmatimonadaceae bacterium]
MLIGTDVALLEGIAQTLGTAGHRTTLAASLADAAGRPLSGEAPLLLVVERELAVGGAGRPAELLRAVPLAPGGALLLFRRGGGAHDAGSATTAGDEGALPAALRRTTLAELTLPLERHRLVALAHTVEERARRTGRGQIPTPPEHRAF